jgi:hypothetical protein
VNCAPDGIPEANGDLRKIYRNEIVAKPPHDIIAGSLPIQNLHERGLVFALGKHRVRLLAYRTPKLVLCELL